MNRYYLMVVVIGLSGVPIARAEQTRGVADAIRIETTRPNDDPAGRPLPLVSHWNTGMHPRSKDWGPASQMQMIEQGHHVLPWFPFGSGISFAEYYESPLKKARQLKLPLVFVGTQWEYKLSGEPYLGLPPEKNPNVVTVEGKTLRKVCPFGPIEPWREVGTTWTNNRLMKQIQECYPDPPLVIFLSNNEHGKLRWTEVETSRRYLEKYGESRDDDFKRKVVADGWIERYRALQEGMRQGLANDTWKKNSIYIGYDTFGPPHFGRWGGWMQHSQYSEGRVDPGAPTWDGGSPSYYTDDWQARTDYTVWSPQVEFMNLVFMRREALKLNPRFWFEFSVWDGYHADPEREKRYPAKRGVYRTAGQTYNPERYGGFVQFGMWLMRPRAVREFRGSTEPWNDRAGEDGRVTHEGGGPYFMAIAQAVDRVHTNPILRHWWRKGELVPNRAHKHPYQAAVPEEYRDEDRWFLLDTNLDAERPWNLETQIRVFSLALVQGEKPYRRWLVYAHSPLKNRKNVKITVPDYRELSVDVSVAGSFYLIDEKGGRVKLVE